MKKLLNKKGFTLMEMMIVIAIIVILVAISVPTFSGSMDKANSATDAANLRAAKAAFINEFMNEAPTATTYYDVTTGDITTTKPSAQGKCDNHSGAVIQYDAENKTAIWVPATGDTAVDQDCSGAN